MKPIPSLRRYLSLQLGLVLVLQFAIVTLLVWQVLLPRMRRDIAFENQALAQTIAGQVTAHLVSAKHQLGVLADLIENQGKLLPTDWNQLLDRQCETSDLFEAIYIADYQSETIHSIGLARQRRNQREDLMGLNLSGRDFLSKSRQHKSAVWSETFLSTASSRWAVALTIPLSDYVIVGEIPIDQLDTMISDLPLTAGMFIMILDRRGWVVGDSQGLYSGQQLDIAGLPAPGPFGNGSSTTSNFELKGRRLIGTSVDVAQLGWKVLVAQSQQSAFQLIQSAFIIIAVGLCISLLCGLLFMGFQARKLTRLIGRYEQKAHSIAQGQYDLLWPPPETKELARLADSLQQMAMNISQRENQLAASENHLSITLDSIGDAVITTDTHSMVTRMNPAAEQLTGWSNEEAVGRALTEVFQIINGISRKTVENPVQKVMARGEIVGLANHTVLIDKTGREYQIADSAAPIRHTDGSIVGVVLVFRNVSEIYTKEQAIRESEERLTQAVRVSEIGVFDYNHLTDTLYWSPQQREIHGLAPDEPITAESTRELIHPEDQERVGEALQRSRDPMSGGLWVDEFRILHKNGSLRWLRSRSQTFFEGKGKTAHPVRTFGASQDITVRKQWESALKASERRFKELFENAPVMYVETYHRNETAYIKGANNLFLETLGYSREEVRDTLLGRYYTEEYRKGLVGQRTYHLTKKGEFTPEERHLLTKDGRIIYTLMDTSPEFDDTGKLIGIRSMYLNISQRIQAEQEAKRLERALLQAQKMEAIGTLAGGIAHDFNNILSAVIGYSELVLIEENKASATYRNVEQILAAGMRAKDLVNQILAFSRQDERQLKPLQIGPLVKEALKLLRSSLPTTIEIKQEIASKLDNVLADPTQIHQIVMNLCANAAQAMEEEGGRLTVDLSEVKFSAADISHTPRLKPGNYIKLSIKDTGYGIPAESLGKIFEPYFTTKEKGKGTGLGLSVVHGIVQNFGGIIDVASKPGQGSTFSVYIPAIEKRYVPEHTARPSLPTGKEHILLVDDEPVLIEVGQLMLERLGYRVSTCNSGMTALETFNGTPGDFDLVISDMTMPKMTGDKLTEALLKIRPELPIILCTGFSSKVSDDKIAEMGIKALVMKPLVQSDLAFLVRKILDEAKKGGTSSEEL